MTKPPSIPTGKSVLMVCTANVCRSPYMAAALTGLLQSRGRDDITVESAGTEALVGQRTAAPMRGIMTEEGLASDWLAHQLDRAMLDRSGLIITASREHRSAVVKLRPAALRRTFTVRQLGRLLDLGPLRVADADVDDVAAACVARRGQAGPSAGADDDVVDPWGGPNSLYRASVETMRPPLIALADALTGRGC